MISTLLQAILSAIPQTAPPMTWLITTTWPCPVVWTHHSIRLLLSGSLLNSGSWRPQGTIRNLASLSTRSPTTTMLRATKMALIGNQQHQPKQPFFPTIIPTDPPQPSDAAGLCSRLLDYFQKKANHCSTNS